jgi:flagellar biosynthetic protein FliR
VALARCGLGELAVGAGLGLSLGLVVAAARLAGDLIGAQAGLSAASLLDPEALDAGEVTPLGHLHALIAMGVFLALDGPLRLLEAVIGSYRAFPAGGLTLDRALVARAFGRVDEALALALSAAAPVALALVTAGLALGLLARAASGVQVLALALSVRWLLAIVLVALLLGLLAGQFTGAWTTALAALSAAGPAAGGPR